jgi:hypothetical protein
MKFPIEIEFLKKNEICLQGYLCPHVLDSTGKSIQWLSAYFKSATVEVTSQAHERFSSILELAIR